METDRRISDAELTELWADLKERGVLHNGMTHIELAKRYGERVYHVLGDGWYVRAHAHRPVPVKVPRQKGRRR